MISLLVNLHLLGYIHFSLFLNDSMVHRRNKICRSTKKSINLFTNQIEKASKENKSIIILGDANLCALRWEYPEFGHHLIAEEILGTLAQCGLTNINISFYLRDHNKYIHTYIKAMSVGHIKRAPIGSPEKRNSLCVSG